jgi:hypothetical protein
MITAAMRTAMHGVFPSLIATCGLDGVPNATVVSQIYYVDENHVAMSHQFFNKTHKNVRENPYVEAIISSVELRQCWTLGLRFARSETEGPIFDDMDMQIEAIASMTGMSGIFKLRAADIYEVESVAEMAREDVA